MRRARTQHGPFTRSHTYARARACTHTKCIQCVVQNTNNYCAHSVSIMVYDQRWGFRILHTIVHTCAPPRAMRMHHTRNISQCLRVRFCVLARSNIMARTQSHRFIHTPPVLSKRGHPPPPFHSTGIPPANDYYYYWRAHYRRHSATLLCRFMHFTWPARPDRANDRRSHKPPHATD